MIPKFLRKYKDRPFFIAEMSANHSGKIENALKIIDGAVKANASAIKFQTYRPESMTLNTKNSGFIIKEKTSLWKNKSLFDLFKIGQTPYKWNKILFNYAKKKKILAFSSVFDEEGVDLLESLNNPIYKISSFENNHFPLLKKVVKTKKPIIISLGLTNLKKIYEIVEFIKINGCKEFVLLKCTSVYPAQNSQLNLKTIQDLKKRFKCPVGFSDHTRDISAAIAASALGADVIEKHFIHSSISSSLDKKFSINEKDFKKMVEFSNLAKLSAGKINYDLTKLEKSRLIKKRSIHSSQDIKKGTIFNKNNIKVVRPGYGLEPKFYEDILGKKAKKNIKFAKPITKNHF